MGVALLGALCLACIRLLSAAGVLAFKSTRRDPQRRLVARIEGELGGRARAATGLGAREGGDRRPRWAGGTAEPGGRPHRWSKKTSAWCLRTESM
jgi:hypothetical protein